MRKLFLPILLLLIVPSLGFSQGSILMDSISGKVEIKQVSAKTFSPLTPSSRLVQPGDIIRTGADGTVTLTLPDLSYLVVAPNSNVMVQDFWSGSTVRGALNVLLGRVRFFVNKFGGKTSPYRLETPTALIAVRGTIYDVYYDGQTTEVECLEGSVVVVNVAFPGSDERVLLPGKKTLVAPGAPPTIPIALNESFSNRELRLIKRTSPEQMDGANVPLPGDRARDNDRMNRPSDRMNAPGSQTDPNVYRAKPSVSFP